MTIKITIKKIDGRSRPSFSRSVKKLSPNLQVEVRKAVEDLLQSPIPTRRRIEKLGGYHSPPIYTIHVTNNHSHKLSFEMSGSTAILRRVDTHKRIDKAP